MPKADLHMLQSHNLQIHMTVDVAIQKAMKNMLGSHVTNCFIALLF